LTTFSLLMILQSADLNFYGPISDQIEDVKGWSMPEIAWLANTVNIIQLLLVLPSTFLIDRKGLRAPTLASALFLLCAAASRCMPGMPAHSGLVSDYVMGLFAMLCSGVAGIWFLYGGCVISATWFPARERCLATALMTTTSQLGTSVGFIVEPLVVPQGPGAAAGLQRLSLGEVAVCGLLVAAVAVHFPDRPAIPPSLSVAEVDEARPYASVKDWCRLGLAITVSAVPTGVYFAWIPMLTLNLSGFGISEWEATRIGCFMSFFGVLGGVVFGKLSDRLPGRLKELVLLCLACTAAGFAWFALVVNRALPGGVAALRASSMIGGFFMNPVLSLGYEFAVEIGYPSISEPQAAGVASFVNIVVQIIFLCLCPDTPASSAWMIWLNVVASAGMLPVLAAFPARYPRLELDGVAAVDEATEGLAATERQGQTC